MPKFTSEIDLDAKTHKFYIDGLEIPADEFSLSSYLFSDVCTSSDDPNDTYRSYCVSYGHKDGGDSITKNIYWSSRDGRMSESLTLTSMAKEIKKLIQKTVAYMNLQESLTKIFNKK